MINGEMLASTMLARAVLAGAILTSTIGTFIALSPPNSKTEQVPPIGDSLNSLGLTSSTFGKLAMSPLFVLSLHSAILALFYPDLPASLVQHGRLNGFNEDLITWSPSTITALTFLFIGICLRLVPYATLGSNFTFFLSSPDRLVTTGIYSYAQHPSYLGLVLVVLANFVLLGRPDGIVCCWLPPKQYENVRGLLKLVLPIVVSALLFAVRTRVIEEETMLNREFGTEWRAWHKSTARFIPGVF